MYNQSWQTQMPYQMPMQTAPSLVGKIVNKIDEATPGCVPMDGTLGVFPLSDGSAVFTKRWKGDGTIEQIEYRPINAPRPALSPIEQELMNRIEALEARNEPVRHEPIRYDEPFRNGPRDDQEQSTRYEQPRQQADDRRDYEQR